MHIKLLAKSYNTISISMLKNRSLPQSWLNVLLYCLFVGEGEDIKSPCATRAGSWTLASWASSRPPRRSPDHPRTRALQRARHNLWKISTIIYNNLIISNTVSYLLERPTLERLLEVGLGGFLYGGHWVHVQGLVLSFYHRHDARRLQLTARGLIIYQSRRRKTLHRLH